MNKKDKTEARKALLVKKNFKKGPKKDKISNTLILTHIIMLTLSLKLARVD